MSRVIVGIDGSEGSTRALDHAAEEARLRQAVLEVVYVHALPTSRGPFAHGLTAEVMSADLYAQMVDHDREEKEELEERHRLLGERLLTDATAHLPDELKVETTLLFDRRPARRLLDVVQDRADASLVVVGSRGRGELTGLLLGSVSQAVVTHSPVPVTVVPTH